MVTSVIYALAILVIGMVLYLADVFVNRVEPVHLSEYFNIYLCIVGTVWLLWLHVDISTYIRSMKKFAKQSEDLMSKFQLVEGPDGELIISIPMQDKIPQYYCFSKGRHSGSFFLKIGAAAFCLGHLVQCGLNIGRQITFFTSEYDQENEDDVVDVNCQSVPKVMFAILQPIYSFLQLYMIFKFSNVIVNRSKGLARFAFMHCISSSLCFWVYTIINETLDSIVAKEFFYGDSGCFDNGTCVKKADPSEGWLH